MTLLHGAERQDGRQGVQVGMWAIPDRCKGILFPSRLLTHWNNLPRGTMEFSFLEIFNSQLVMILINLKFKKKAK